MSRLQPFCLASAFAAIVFAASTGCSTLTTPNVFVHDTPATTYLLGSPAAADVVERFRPADIVTRDWPIQQIAPASGVVHHGPLYFEDPFEDKGATYDYCVGWEDAIAVPYSYARYALNGFALPISMIVTPPWTVIESDGRLSEQCLGYDHDAVPAGREDGEEWRRPEDIPTRLDTPQPLTPIGPAKAGVEPYITE